MIDKDPQKWQEYMQQVQLEYTKIVNVNFLEQDPQEVVQKIQRSFDGKNTPIYLAALLFTSCLVNQESLVFSARDMTTKYLMGDVEIVNFITENIVHNPFFWSCLATLCTICESDYKDLIDKNPNLNILCKRIISSTNLDSDLDDIRNFFGVISQNKGTRQAFWLDKMLSTHPIGAQRIVELLMRDERESEFFYQAKKIDPSTRHQGYRYLKKTPLTLEAQRILLDKLESKQENFDNVFALYLNGIIDSGCAVEYMRGAKFKVSRESVKKLLKKIESIMEVHKNDKNVFLIFDFCEMDALELIRSANDLRVISLDAKAQEFLMATIERDRVGQSIAAPESKSTPGAFKL